MSTSSPSSSQQHNNQGRNLSESVRWAVDAFVRYQTAEGSVDPMDVYRCLREQANLLYERQILFDAIRSDPFRQFQEIRSKLKNIKDRIEVTSCSRIMTWEGYALIQATVHFSKPPPVVTSTPTSPQTTTTTPSFSLHFRYERQPSQNKVWYSIDLSADADTMTTTTTATTTTTTTSEASTNIIEPPPPSRRILEIEVWTVGNRGPSVLPAQPIEMDDDDDDDDADNDDENVVKEDEEDKDDDDGSAAAAAAAQENDMEVEDDNHHHVEEEESHNAILLNGSINGNRHSAETKKTKNNKKNNKVSVNSSTPVKEEEDDDENHHMQLEEEDNDDEIDNGELCDRYTAFLDPEILSDFGEWTQLQPIPEVTAFFFLMTFPYYELEWDLIGMVLESAFDDDGNGDDDEGNDDEDSEKRHIDGNDRHDEHNEDDDEAWDDDDDDDEEEDGGK